MYVELVLPQNAGPACPLILAVLQSFGTHVSASGAHSKATPNLARARISIRYSRCVGKAVKMFETKYTMFTQTSIYSRIHFYKATAQTMLLS